MTTATEVQPCTPQDVGIDYNDETPQSLKDVLEKYFAQFDAPRIEGANNIMISSWKCACGAPLGGFVGSFTWGIVHGEGYCSQCKRPGRAHHYLVDEKGEEFATLRNIILLVREELLLKPADAVAP